MLMIPVLDLHCGIVVHAKKGERQNYQAIISKIAPNSEPQSIIAAFLKLYPFKIIYIADLNAIQGQPSQHCLINELALQFRHCEFWLDAGVEAIKNKQYTAHNIQLVLGAENAMPRKALEALITNNPDLILSLDFNQQGLISNQYLLDTPSILPRKLIVMMLHRVGLAAGVDWQCLENIVAMLAMGQRHEIYAAGGIHDFKSLRQLKAMGIHGALLATALHDGSIGQDELNNIISLNH